VRPFLILGFLCFILLPAGLIRQLFIDIGEHMHILHKLVHAHALIGIMGILRRAGAVYAEGHSGLEGAGVGSAADGNAVCLLPGAALINTA